MNILRDKFLLSGLDAERFTDHLFYEAGNVRKLDMAAKRVSTFWGFDQATKRDENIVDTLINQVNKASGKINQFVKIVRDSISSGQMLPSDIRTAAYEWEI